MLVVWVRIHGLPYAAAMGFRCLCACPRFYFGWATRWRLVVVLLLYC